MVKFDFPGRVLRRRGGAVAIRRRRPHTAVSKGMSQALRRLATSGAPKFKRGTATRVAYGKKRQNLMKTIVAPGRGGLPSFSKFALTNKPNKTLLAMKRVSAPNYRVYNGSEQIVNLEGFQNAGVYAWNDRGDLLAIQALVPAQTTTYPFAPNRYHLESMVGELLMTNSSLATQYIDIYDIVQKRDTGYNPGAPGTGPTANPLNAWKYGVSDQSPTAPDLNAWECINSLPTDSKLFNDWFRIIKRSHIGLTAGATHRHSVVLKPNKIVDAELLQRCNGNLAGFTCYSMVVINGQPASVKSEAGAVVTTATTALDVVVARRTKYSYVQDNTTVWNVVDNLQSLVNEQVTQDGLGSFVTNSIV